MIIARKDHNNLAKANFYKKAIKFDNANYQARVELGDVEAEL